MPYHHPPHGPKGLNPCWFSGLCCLNKGLNTFLFSFPDFFLSPASTQDLSKGAGSQSCCWVSLGHILVGHIYSLSLVLQIWGPQGTPVHMCWECGSHCAWRLWLSPWLPWHWGGCSPCVMPVWWIGGTAKGLWQEATHWRIVVANAGWNPDLPVGTKSKCGSYWWLFFFF